MKSSLPSLNQSPGTARDGRNANGSKFSRLISSYILFPPRLIVRYCPARIVLMAVSSLTSPANPGTSGIRTTTCNGGKHSRNGLPCVGLTLNFSCARAARRILSTSASAMRFCTGPSFLVLEMLKGIRTCSAQKMENGHTRIDFLGGKVRDLSERRQVHNVPM